MSYYQHKESYNITDINDCIDREKHQWLVDNVPEQYKIINDGYLIDNYKVTFLSEDAELAYLLVWA